MPFPRRFLTSAAPKTARLFDSVPPEVKTTCPPLAPSADSTCPAACVTRFSAATPRVCSDEGFPYSFS